MTTSYAFAAKIMEECESADIGDMFCTVSA
jgi:hypothetical protein